MSAEILDHGYLKVIDVWGSDERIIEAARMSTGKGFLGWGPKEEPCPRCGMSKAQKRAEAVRDGRARDKPCDGASAKGLEPCFFQSVPGDEKLLRYLWENRHHTPFEMAGLTIEVMAPIFVFREWHRHLTKQAGTVKGSDALDELGAKRFQHALKESYAASEMLYQNALQAGVPKELARVHLPVGRYSKMRATSNLRGWLGFLALRMDEKAQYEIRVYADLVGESIAQAFPRTWTLFSERKATK